MRYQNVCLEALACTVPEEVVSSADIEARLEPAYRRLRLHEGRLELITGIVQRRFWPPGTRPSAVSALTAEKALRMAGWDKRDVGVLVHGSVCRDCIEPATASFVHDRLGLPPQCMAFDISNACLGLMNGVLHVANAIELGQIRAGLVVGTESARHIVENTIRLLNEAPRISRAEAKRALATLTLGSGSAAILLVHRDWSRTGNRLLGGTAWTRSQACHLCIGGEDPSIGTDSELLMWTDSEQLMHQAIQTCKEAFPSFLEATGWSAGQIDRVFCHQVSRAHRELLIETLGIDPAIDYPTVEFLGNTGAVAVAMTAAIGVHLGAVKPGDHVGLWGAGSGINVIGLGIDWQRSLVDPETLATIPPQAKLPIDPNPAIRPPKTPIVV